jgi:hypothetical protein
LGVHNDLNRNLREQVGESPLRSRSVGQSDDQALHDRARRRKADLLEDDHVDARLPERRIAGRLDAAHPGRQRLQPGYAYGRAVEVRQVPVHAEHPVHERERPVVFALVALKRDGERPRTHLSHASDYRLARPGQRGRTVHLA